MVVGWEKVDIVRTANSSVVLFAESVEVRILLLQGLANRGRQAVRYRLKVARPQEKRFINNSIFNLYSLILQLLYNDMISGELDIRV